MQLIKKWDGEIYKVELVASLIAQNWKYLHNMLKNPINIHNQLFKVMLYVCIYLKCID